MTLRCTAATIALVTTIACGGRSLAPETLPVDRVECARCRMIVSSASGAGEIVSTSDEPRFYDDVGCLAAQAKSIDAATSRAYVNVDGEWMQADAAFYAEPANARTAMASGIVAFRTEAAARAADRQGRALTWEQVLDR